MNDGLCQNISGTENFGVEQYTVHCGVTPPAASSRETIDATTWSGQRVTGVDVEHNEHVTGDEYGACNVITGTPYVGPNQYQTFCSAESEEKAEHKISSEMASDNFISGDVLSSTDHVTGTQRGSEHTITGTPYYKADPEGEEKMGAMERIKKINNSFSVHSPQRQSQNVLVQMPSMPQLQKAELQVRFLLVKVRLPAIRNFVLIREQKLKPFRTSRV